MDGIPGWQRTVGRILSGLFIAFMVMDGGIKLVPIPEVGQTMAQLGWPTHDALMRGLGVLLLVLTALYAWPRTAFLGAILLSGYLGGAVATHMRVGSPLFTHTLFSFYIGAIMWGGLWLRNRATRNALPLVRRESVG